MGGDKIRQYKLGIYDSDTSYMLNLMNHINSDRNNPLFALAFSDAEELGEYVRTRGIDVLVVDEELYSGIKLRENPMKCVYLTRYRDFACTASLRHEVCETEASAWRYGSAPVRVGSVDGEPVCRVFKYSRVSDIVASIMRFMNINDPEKSRRLFKSYGVISPIGRCGKTNLAISLCMNDEVRGGLYVGMEEYGAFQEQEDIISNVIYLAKERSDRFVDYVENHVVRLEGYSVLGYMRSYTDAMELEADDMAWMLDRFQEWGRYTTVVWDMGQAVLKDLAVLGTFDEIVVPVLGDEQSKDKIKAFEELLERKELGKLVCRMKKLHVPNSAPDSPRMLSLMESEFGG